MFVILAIFMCFFTYGYFFGQDCRVTSPKFHFTVKIWTGLILICSIVLMGLAGTINSRLVAEYEVFTNWAKVEPCVDSYMQIGEYQTEEINTNYIYGFV